MYVKNWGYISKFYAKQIYINGKHEEVKEDHKSEMNMERWPCSTGGNIQSKVVSLRLQNF